MKPDTAKLSLLDRARVKLGAWLYGPFEATQWSRNRPIWPVYNASAKEEANTFNRVTLASHARLCYNNFGFAKRAVDLIPDFAIGSGLTVKPMTGDPGIDTTYDSYFSQWSSLADLRGMSDLDGLFKIGLREVVIAGDCGFVMTKSPDTNQCRLQAVPFDRIADDPDRKDTVEGVGLSPQGRPLFYRLKQDDGSFTDVSAQNFIFILDPRHFDSMRGLSALHAGINRCRDVNDIVKAETAAARELSSWNIISKSARGEGELNPLSGDADPAAVAAGNAIPTMRTLTGGTKYVQVGEDFQVFNPNGNRPSPAWQGLMQFNLNDVAAGLNLPIEFIQDPSKLGTSAGKMILASAQQTIEHYQRLVARHYSRIYIWVVASGIKSGMLPQAPNFWRHELHFPAELTLNARQAVNDQNDYRLGLTSGTRLAAAGGADIADIIEEKAKEARLRLDAAKKYNVPVDMIQILTANGNTFEPTNAPEPQN